MPNIWTHLLFCEDVIDAVKQPYPFSQYEPYMKLGAQGPDPFFYYNFWPWIKEEPVHEIGMELHTKQCGEFLMDLIISAKDQCSEVKAYVTGFITHHLLDRHTHPYIHYRAGYKGNNHQKLEILIDTVMMEKFHKLKTWKSPVYKEINVGKTLNPEISALLDHKINKYYPHLKQSNPEYIQRSYKDMMLALKILADPRGWKNLLFGSMISPFSHQPIKDDIDYLNLNHTTWYHPATNEPSNKSFIELYSKARGECIDIIIELKNYWEKNSEHSRQRLTELIDHISYDTGKPLKLGLVNKYSDPIV
ncbi:zinc dependent phospholipase C family protein [Oceanobacillus damuensis]|uniref:zinc dependent phospholipase C family protein n=1 Tax=Oceanobacillus damuensis TaxID=937928 RepID=UPI000831AC28|nr:zinc dependent phospholipase C family protein [Oceanobacillus damuensis]